MQNCAETGCELIAAAYKHTTLTSYSNSYNLFCDFVTRAGLDQLWEYHAHPANLIIFLGYLKNQKKAAATARKHLSGISHCLKINLLPDYTKSAPVVKAMSGYSSIAKTKDLRLPISLGMLVKMHDALSEICYSHYETLLFRAAFTIAFAALLRVSEIAAVSKETMGHAILHSGVVVKPASVSLHLHSSKTDKSGKGVWIHLCKSGMDVCPVAAVKAFKEVRPKVEGTFFCHANSTQGHVNPLTKYQFNAILKKAITAIQVSAMRYSSHSFRIGATTHLAAASYDDNTIKRLGRWSQKGNTHKIYVRNIQMPSLCGF